MSTLCKVHDDLCSQNHKDSAKKKRIRSEVKNLIYSRESQCNFIYTDTIDVNASQLIRVNERQPSTQVHMYTSHEVLSQPTDKNALDNRSERSIWQQVRTPKPIGKHSVRQKISYIINIQIYWLYASSIMNHAALSSERLLNSVT